MRRPRKGYPGSPEAECGKCKDLEARPIGFLRKAPTPQLSPSPPILKQRTLSASASSRLYPPAEPDKMRTITCLRRTDERGDRLVVAPREWQEHCQSAGAAVHGAIQGVQRGAGKMKGRRGGALGRGHAFDRRPPQRTAPVNGFGLSQSRRWHRKSTAAAEFCSCCLIHVNLLKTPSQTENLLTKEQLYAFLLI